MKRIVLIFATVVLLCGTGHATQVLVSSSSNWSALTVGATDTVIIASGATLTLDLDKSLTPACRFLFVRSGGTFDQGAYGFMCNALWLGGISAAPFSSSNGGKHTGGNNGSVWLRHDAGFTYDYYIGPNSTDTIAVRYGTFTIRSDQPATHGYARAYCDNTTAKVYWDGVAFKAMYRGTYTGGVEFNSTGRLGSKTTIKRCSFDSTNVAFTNTTGHKLDSCTITIYPAMAQAVLFRNSTADTLYRSTIIVSLAGGTDGPKGVYCSGASAPVIIGSRIQEIYTSAYGGGYGVLWESVGTGAKLINDTLIGFGFTLSSSGTGAPGAVIQGCRFEGNSATHETILLHDGDKKWTIRGNTIGMYSAGGRSAITVYCSSVAADSLNIHYNTISGLLGGSPASACIAFEHTSAGNLVYNDIKMVGNLMFGNNSGFANCEVLLGTVATTQSVTVNFTEFKNNAYDSVYALTGSSATYPYTYSDSNKNNATAFAFRDSANGDFYLTDGSLMLNCGDSTYYVSVFGASNAGTANGDIGAMQRFTYGSCPTTPPATGACCLPAGTCITTTAAACTSATYNGTYAGNDVSCATAGCGTPGPGPIGRHYSHILTAQINYDASGTLGKFCSRYDLLIGVGDKYMDSAVKYGNKSKGLVYIKDGTLYPSVEFPAYYVKDSTYLWDFCVSKGYNFNDFLLVASDTVTISGMWPYAPVQRTTLPGNRLEFNAFNTYRWGLDMRNPHMGEYFWYRLQRCMTDNPKFQGVMADEAAQWSNSQYGGPILLSQMFPWGVTRQYLNGSTWITDNIWVKGNHGSVGWTKWQAVTSANQGSISDSLIRVKWSWMGAFSDSVSTNGYLYIRNPAAYFDMLDSTGTLGGGILTTWPNDFEGDNYKGSRRINELLGEGAYLNCTQSTGRHLQYLNYVQRLVDSGCQTVLWLNMTPTDTTRLTTARARMERLCYYYMAADPNNTWVLQQTNYGVNNLIAADTSNVWCPAIAYNIGTPTAKYSTMATGTDGASQAYTVRKRPYSNGLVLWRQSVGGTWNNTSASASIALGGNYQEVLTDGTLSPTVVTTTTIRNAEGKIFANSGSAQPATTPNKFLKGKVKLTGKIRIGQ